MDYAQSAQLDQIRRELARQTVVLEQLLDGFARLREQLAAVQPSTVPAAPAPAPAPGSLRRAVRRLLGRT